MEWLGTELDPASLKEKAVSGAGGVLGILLVMAVSHSVLGLSGAAMLIASMGASVVLVFGVPHGALSQPWPVLAGHGISAAIGVTCARLMPDAMLAAACAVGLSIVAMRVLKCIPPRGRRHGIDGGDGRPGGARHELFLRRLPGAAECPRDRGRSSGCELPFRLAALPRRARAPDGPSHRSAQSDARGRDRRPGAPGYLRRHHGRRSAPSPCFIDQAGGGKGSCGAEWEGGLNAYRPVCQADRRGLPSLKQVKTVRKVWDFCAIDSQCAVCQHRVMTDSTATVVAAIIGGAVALIVGRWQFLHRGSEKESIASAPKTSMDGSDNSCQLIESCEPKKLERGEPLQILDESHLKIVETIEAALPYHRSDIEQTFRGRRVCWEMKLLDIHRRNDGIAVSGELIDDKSFVFCKARIEDCFGLETISSGAIVAVEGDLDIVGRYETWIENCIIRRKNS